MTMVSANCSLVGHTQSLTVISRCRLPSRAVACCLLKPVKCCPLANCHNVVRRRLHTSSRRESGSVVARAVLPPVPAVILQPVLPDLGEGLEAPVQLLYLAALLAFLAVAAWLVVRQVLIRRELEEAAKVLGERIRTGEANFEDYFELGVILLRKKLYTQSTKNLEKAKKTWQGDPAELAQVHNALGFAYLNMEKVDLSVKEFQKAVELQPGYVTAWNNLGDAYEREENWQKALEAYTESLSYSPENKIAGQRAEALRTRLRRIGANSS